MSNRRRYAAAYMLDKPKLGEVFTKWPLHITVLPWFECQDIAIYVGMLEKTARKIRPFYVTVGREADFGPDGGVPVKLVNKTYPLTELHATVCRLLMYGKGHAGSREERITRPWRPHITVRGDRHISTGTKVLVDSLDIVEDIKDGRMGRKSVARIKFLG